MRNYKIMLRMAVILSAIFLDHVLADPIKIGLVGPFSGPYIAAGDQQWQGAMQAVEDINAHGGVNGDKLHLVVADDRCDRAKAVKIAERFVNQGDIRAVIGHNCSAATLAAAKIYAAANMLLITPASTTPEITEQNYKTIFRTCGRDDKQGDVAAEFISNKLKTKKVAILYIGSVYGKAVAENTKQALDRLGNPAIIYQEVSKDQNENSAVLNKLSQLNPEVIYFGGLHTDAGIFLKALRSHGNKTIFVGSDGIASPDFVRSAGGPNVVNNVYMTFFRDPSNLADAKKVVKELEARYISPTGYILNSYAAVQAIAAALENAPHDMSGWLHTHEVDTVIGPLQWDKKGDLEGNPFIVYKWNAKGQYEPYWAPQ